MRAASSLLLCALAIGCESTVAQHSPGTSQSALTTVVATAADFAQNGNPESNLDIASPLLRAAPVGGAGAWTAGSPLAFGRAYFGSAAYAGYLYVEGGDSAA